MLNYQSVCFQRYIFRYKMINRHNFILPHSIFSSMNRVPLCSVGTQSNDLPTQIHIHSSACSQLEVVVISSFHFCVFVVPMPTLAKQLRWFGRKKTETESNKLRPRIYVVRSKPPVVHSYGSMDKTRVRPTNRLELKEVFYPFFWFQLHSTISKIYIRRIAWRLLHGTHLQRTLNEKCIPFH